jgi:hypothetical protein
MEGKKCSKCGQEKPITDFYVSRTKIDGLDCYCKKCRNEITKEYRSRLVEKANKNVEIENVPATILIEELRRRGYRGELEFIQRVEI